MAFPFDQRCFAAPDAGGSTTPPPGRLPIISADERLADPRRDEAGRRNHDEIGWLTRLCDLTEEQVLTLIEVAIGGFQDAMHQSAHDEPEAPF